jgi:hypothetical protein
LIEAIDSQLNTFFFTKKLRPTCYAEDRDAKSIERSS